MIIEDNVLKSWDIYSAEQFEKVFNISEPFGETECDEDYIMEHLEKDKRKFRVVFMESARDNAYEEFWRIQEVE